MEKQILNIKDGPGKFELAISLFDGEDKLPNLDWVSRERQPVNFHLSEEHERANVISGVIEQAARQPRREGPEGKFRFTLTLRLGDTAITRLGHKYENTCVLDYDTQSRTGTVVLQKRSPTAPGYGTYSRKVAVKHV